jgi:toxin-antitoxin system PIN domain toxin
MIDLLDVNVWLALVDQRHVHYPLALTYWNQNEATQLAFCRTTMLGFLRLTTSPKAVANPKNSAEAWAIYQDLIALPNIQFLEEPAGIDAHFHALTTRHALPHRMWTDAYLAAYALASGARLVSFDADFARFPGLPLLHLHP